MARLSVLVALTGLLAQQTIAYSTLNDVELPACSNQFTPFEPVGCYQDYDGKTLAFRSTVTSTGMTGAKCQAICKGNGYHFAGLKYYGICFCGTKIEGPKLIDSNCTLPCDGNKKETCGGTDSLTIYSDPTFIKITDPVDVDDYEDEGCFTDDSSLGRTLGVRQDLDAATITPELCIKSCLASGLPYAGVEFGSECWCGALRSTFSQEVSGDDCNMPCNGDKSLDCGGRGRINIFVAEELLSQDPCDNDDAPPKPTTPTTPATTNSPPSTPSTPATTNNPPYTNNNTTLYTHKTKEPTKEPPTTAAPPTTTRAPPNTNTPTPSNTKVCTTVVPKDEWCVGGWCNEPIPDFNDEKTCFSAWSKCHLQSHACLKFAGWPDVLECGEYKKWCKNTKLFCHRSCTSKSKGCSKSNYHAQNPPRGGDKKDSWTKTIPCPEATATTTTDSIPEPTNICKQPHNPKGGYTTEDPVGDIELPIVACNGDEADHRRGNLFKQYDHSVWGKCPSYRRDDVPRACREACKQQYDRCRDVYAKSRDTKKDRDDNDKSHGKPEHKNKHNHEHKDDRKNDGKKGRKHQRDLEEETFDGLLLSPDSVTTHPKDEYHTALHQCKEQYEDCRKVNNEIKGDGKCIRYNSAW
ncbi:hypothetical protein ACHAQA_005231 [Verticillium albo-atrum]